MWNVVDVSAKSVYQFDVTHACTQLHFALFYFYRPLSVAVVDCGSPPESDTANMMFASHDNNTKYGAQVHYICEDGQNSQYTLIGLE